MIVCIADLHIGYSDKALALLKRFCRDIVPRTTQLYILGDFFHVWVGYEQLQHNHAMRLACELLNQAITDHKVALFILRGNRDICLDASIKKALPCQFLPDEYVLTAFGTRYLLLHGDTLCTLDVRHQRWRKIISILYPYFLRYLPYIVKSYIGTILRWSTLFLAERKARHRRYTTDQRDVQGEDILDVTQTAVNERLQHFQSYHMIHGHTHCPQHHTWCLGNERYHRFVLGSWDDGKTVYAAITVAGVTLCHYDGDSSAAEPAKSHKAAASHSA